MQIETLLNTPKPQALDYMSVDKGGKYILPLGRLVRKPKEPGQLKTVKEVADEGYTVRELENGTIEVEQAGALVVPAKPVLRALAQRLNLSLLNANGNPYNTRQLGSQVIRTIQELKRTEPTTDP